MEKRFHWPPHQWVLEHGHINDIWSCLWTSERSTPRDRQLRTVRGCLAWSVIPCWFAPLLWWFAPLLWWFAPLLTSVSSVTGPPQQHDPPGSDQVFAAGVAVVCHVVWRGLQGPRQNHRPGELRNAGGGGQVGVGASSSPQNVSIPRIMRWATLIKLDPTQIDSFIFFLSTLRLSRWHFVFIVTWPQLKVNTCSRQRCWMRRSLERHSPKFRGLKSSWYITRFRVM